MPAVLRSDPLDHSVPARWQAARRARRATWTGGARAVGLLALATSVLYFVSDLIEVVQGRFSTGSSGSPSSRRRRFPSSSSACGSCNVRGSDGSGR